MAEPRDDVDERTGDAELLAGLRGRRQAWQGVVGVLWAVFAAGQLASGNTWVGAANVGLALCWGWIWWVSPQPHVRTVTGEAVLVRQGLRTRSIDRAQVADVRAKHLDGYGLVLTLREGEAVRLSGTAPRWSLAAAQAAALRRWAGVGEPVS